jgi:hypothetical protein
MKLIKSFISVLVFGLIFASCENPNISNYYNNINQDNGGGNNSNSNTIVGIECSVENGISNRTACYKKLKFHVDSCEISENQISFTYNGHSYIVSKYKTDSVSDLNMTITNTGSAYKFRVYKNNNFCDCTVSNYDGYLQFFFVRDGSYLYTCHITLQIDEQNDTLIINIVEQ